MKIPDGTIEVNNDTTILDSFVQLKRLEKRISTLESFCKVLFKEIGDLKRINKTILEQLLMKEPQASHSHKLIEGLIEKLKNTR